MIDLPNLIAGFILGLVPTLLLWWADHSKQRTERRRDAFDAWRGLAKEIEGMLYDTKTKGQDIHNAYARHPVDTWRAILGPEDFRLLEDLEQAYFRVEHPPPISPSQVIYFGQEVVPELTAEDAIRRKNIADKQDVNVRFINRARMMQNEAYGEVIDAEQRARLWADYRAHPVRTWKRERNNKRVRRANPWPDGTATGGKH